MVLLDCIQRTGMSPNDTRGCFARSDVEGSPLRQGLYQCGVCRECMQAADAEEKKAICKDYQASASSASVGGGQKKVGGGTAPSASAWQQYVPKYMPGGGMLKTPTGWF